MICSRLVMFAIASLLLACSSNAQGQDKCGGDAKQAHTIGQYKFYTASRVQKGTGVELYETCIENASGRWLWADWKVPGPITWIPDGEAFTSPRPFVTRDTKSFKGCLEYGNLAESLHEPFMGHSSDAAEIALENCTTTVQLAPMPSPTADEIPLEVTYPVKILFPSDTADAEGTMLELDGQVSLHWKGARDYATYASFTVTPFRGSRGIAQEVTMRPTGEGPEFATFKEAFVETPDIIEGSYHVQEKNDVSVQYSYPSTSPVLSLRPAKYGFWDKSGTLVGAFFVPLVLPQ